MRPRRLAQSAVLMSALLFAGAAPAAELVLHNGAIYTVSERQPWAEALAVDKGRIVYVGGDEGVDAHIDNSTRIIDLEGRFVMPGIHDVHVHPLEANNPAFPVCTLTAGVKAPGQLKTIRKCARQQHNSKWVLGWGHYVNDVLDVSETPAKILDRAVPDRPALMQEFTSHSMWANSKALAAGGITADTPDPPGGVIVKDEATGAPTGLLIDNAGNQLMEKVFAPTDALLELTYLGIPEAMAKLARNGITSISDARVYWGRGHHKVWQRAEREGKLTARVVLALWGYPGKGDEQIETLKGLYSDDPERLLRTSQIKLYSDGITTVGTAAMKKAYAFDYGFVAGNKGLSYFSQERMSRFIAELSKTGFDFNIHTIGDRAVHESLNAIEAAAKQNGGSLGRRHRLTHVEVMDEADLPRFKALDVIADFQVAGDWTQPSQIKRDLGYLIGARADRAIPLKSVYDTGATLTLSSDYDVSTLNPFIGMSNALRRGKESLPDIAAVIRAYTINGAYTLRQESRAGSLEPGKFADLIVLDQNLLEIPSRHVHRTKVLMTLLGGKEVFRSSAYTPKEER